MGERGEAHAQSSLERRGLRCLGRRVRTERGEVDLVFRDGPRLLCVEVKAGRWLGNGARFEPGKHFSWRQQRRLRAASAALTRQLAPGSAPTLGLFEVWFDEHGQVAAERFRALPRR